MIKNTIIGILRHKILMDKKTSRSLLFFLLALTSCFVIYSYICTLKTKIHINIWVVFLEQSQRLNA